MRKIYVVQARSYEYNDETYDRSDGGNVVHAYSSEDAANDAVLLKTIESFRNGGMCYLAEAYNVFDDEALDILEKHNLAPSQIISVIMKPRILPTQLSLVRLLRMSCVFWPIVSAMVVNSSLLKK